MEDAMKDLLILGEEKQLQKKLSKLYAGFEKSPKEALHESVLAMSQRCLN